MVTGYVLVRCGHCDKEFGAENWYVKRTIRMSKRGELFCSAHCAQMFHNVHPETRANISLKQKGVSCPQRGRKGHSVSEEVREKLRILKKGKSHTTDWDIVAEEAEFRGINRFAIMRAPIPDIVFIDENGKLAAIEVEKELWQSGITKKMEEYAEFPYKWDKVILVWYTPNGERKGEWILENGEWKPI